MYLRCPSCGAVSPPAKSELYEPPNHPLRCYSCWIPAELYEGSQLLSGSATVADVLRARAAQGLAPVQAKPQAKRQSSPGPSKARQQAS